MRSQHLVIDRMSTFEPQWVSAAAAAAACMRRIRSGLLLLGISQRYNDRIRHSCHIHVYKLRLALLCNRKTDLNAYTRLCIAYIGLYKYIYVGPIYIYMLALCILLKSIYIYIYIYTHTNLCLCIDYIIYIYIDVKLHNLFLPQLLVNLGCNLSAGIH